ncbi:MAG: CRISPR-associated endonuclease Cas2 [Muribaculaceae bacterium]|nr:CRISPR-associated endonuclease Cas2 [Muribaculaceae bacterium]
MDYITYKRVSSYQLMWILVMFDLPTETKIQRKLASDFRKYLLKDGFTMFQFSIYVRNCASRENTKVHIERIKNMIPEEGKVCIITITERQFHEILTFEGKRRSTKLPDAIQLELF